MDFLNNKKIFGVWATLAAFGVYFCTYAFRKPFTAGVYNGYELFGIDYKVLLIFTQIAGYMTSKFIGIKVVSELKPNKRAFLIILLVSISFFGLVLFGLLPYQYAWAALFINGLPLGMVWGVVFSFLEGRRVTEMLALGLSINMIMTSGILKSIYFFVQQITDLDEFWMPATLGLIFFPFLIFFVWMLKHIPGPTEEDRYARKLRVPMTDSDKKNVMRQYGLGVVLVILIYSFLTSLRDFRDNFLVDIWKEIDPFFDISIFAKVESLIALIVLLGIGMISFIKNNKKAYFLINYIILFSFICIGMNSYFYNTNYLSPQIWMIFMGVFLFYPYLLIQVAFFERMIAVFNIKGNVGFFVYMCDSFGYLGSVTFLLYKEFFSNEISWSGMLLTFTYVTALVGSVLAIAMLVYFVIKYKKNSNFNRIALHIRSEAVT